MTRDDAITYVADRLGTLLTDAGIALNRDGLASIVDDALLLTGTAYADLETATVADVAVVGFRVVLNFVAIRAAYDAVINRVDVRLGTPSVEKTRSQMVRQLEQRYRFALDEVQPYLVEVGSGPFSTGAVVLGMTGGDAW